MSNSELKSFIERIERLDEERMDRCNDISMVFKEAKSAGYDVKIMREILKDRRRTKEEREHRAAMIQQYELALGM